MLFSDYLKDVLVEKAVPDSDINYIENDENGIEVVFKVGDVHIRVRIGVSPERYDDIRYELMSIMFMFYDPETGRESSDKLNIGYRHGKTVMDTVVKLIREFMQKNDDIAMVEYSAHGKSRVRLYDRLTKEFIRNGFVDLSRGDEADKEYLLARRDMYEKYKDEA